MAENVQTKKMLNLLNVENDNYKVHNELLKKSLEQESQEYQTRIQQLEQENSGKNALISQYHQELSRTNVPRLESKPKQTEIESKLALIEKHIKEQSLEIENLRRKTSRAPIDHHEEKQYNQSRNHMPRNEFHNINQFQSGMNDVGNLRTEY